MSSLLYTVGFGDKYFKLAECMSKTFRAQGFKEKIIILSDQQKHSNYADVFFVNIQEYSFLYFKENQLKWNLSTSSRLNPILSKICIDQIVNINEYKRIIYVDADSVLTIPSCNFLDEIINTSHTYISRINRNRTAWDCLFYTKKSGKIISDLRKDISKNEEIISKKMDGACSGFFSFTPDNNFLNIFREYYFKLQPTADQECLNLIRIRGLKHKIKQDVFFSDPTKKGLIHFTHGKRNVIEIAEKMNLNY